MVTYKHLLKEQSTEAISFLTSIFDDQSNKLASDYISSMFSNNFRHATFIVAIDGNRIIGTIAYSEELFTTDTWGISWVAVDKKYTNRGIGTKLVKKCIEQITIKSNKSCSIILRTYPGKTRLYDKNGLKKMREDHEGGHYMIKHIRK